MGLVIATDRLVSMNDPYACLEVINPALTGRVPESEQRQQLLHNGRGLAGIFLK